MGPNNDGADPHKAQELLDSRFKYDTEIGDECRDQRSVAEALSRRPS
jgi:hypothetical protein